MPVWDLPEGDEMDTQPGVWSLTRTRYKGAACLKMYVRPHIIRRSQGTKFMGPRVYLQGCRNLVVGPR